MRDARVADVQAGVEDFGLVAAIAFHRIDPAHVDPAGVAQVDLGVAGRRADGAFVIAVGFFVELHARHHGMLDAARLEVQVQVGLVGQDGVAL
ncbi:hypothetical protein G6F65_020981 [Rhizopus arrhizus]|nr:hypothetical protein G6F65_020981 [Rhizopus arrhizus]